MSVSPVDLSSFGQRIQQEVDKIHLNSWSKFVAGLRYWWNRSGNTDTDKATSLYQNFSKAIRLAGDSDAAKQKIIHKYATILKYLQDKYPTQAQARPAEDQPAAASPAKKSLSNTVYTIFLAKFTPLPPSGNFTATQPTAQRRSSVAVPTRTPSPPPEMAQSVPINPALASSPAVNPSFQPRREQIPTSPKKPETGSLPKPPPKDLLATTPITPLEGGPPPPPPLPPPPPVQIDSLKLTRERLAKKVNHKIGENISPDQAATVRTETATVGHVPPEKPTAGALAMEAVAAKESLRKSAARDAPKEISPDQFTKVDQFIAALNNQNPNIAAIADALKKKPSLIAFLRHRKTEITLSATFAELESKLGITPKIAATDQKGPPQPTLPQSRPALRRTADRPPAAAAPPTLNSLDDIKQELSKPNPNYDAIVKILSANEAFKNRIYSPNADFPPEHLAELKKLLPHNP